MGGNVLLPGMCIASKCCFFVACDFALLISDPSEVLIIARTERGQELVDSAKAGSYQWLMSSSKVLGPAIPSLAQEAGKLTLGPADPREILETQSLGSQLCGTSELPSSLKSRLTSELPSCPLRDFSASLVGTTNESPVGFEGGSTTAARVFSGF